MNGMAKMMMLNRSRGDGEAENKRRDIFIREQDPERAYGNYAESYGDYRAENRRMESAGKDFDWDSGRDMEGPESRRYKNGRFAPKNEYRGNQWKEGPIRKPMDEEPEMRMIGFERNDYRPTGSTVDYERNRMHYITPEAHEMEHRKSEKHSGHASGTGENEKYVMAKEWVSKMRNEDGSRGGHWKLEEVEDLLEKKQIDCDPVEAWAAMNALYSDLAKVNGKYGMTSKEYYLEAAIAFFLHDKDAVKDKLWIYYEYIVE